MVREVESSYAIRRLKLEVRFPFTPGLNRLSCSQFSKAFSLFVKIFQAVTPSLLFMVLGGEHGLNCQLPTAKFPNHEFFLH